MNSRKNRSWYAMKATNDKAEIMIYDEIGMWGITAKEFNSDLASMKGRDLDVRLNTPGGSVFEGLAIFNALDRHKGRVTTHVDGLAASIGSVIALAGDEVNMAANAFLMIHDPWAFTIGTATEHRKSAENLDKIASSAVDIYTDRSSMDRDEVVALMAEETWFTAEEAVGAGLADFVAGETDAGEQARFDLSKFHHVPDAIYQSVKEAPETIRDFESQLRGLGYTKGQARDIALHGFENGDRREAVSQGGRRDADARRREADEAISKITKAFRNAI